MFEVFEGIRSGSRGWHGRKSKSVGRTQRRKLDRPPNRVRASGFLRCTIIADFSGFWPDWESCADKSVLDHVNGGFQSSDSTVGWIRAVSSYVQFNYLFPRLCTFLNKQESISLARIDTHRKLMKHSEERKIYIKHVHVELISTDKLNRNRRKFIKNIYLIYVYTVT